MKIKGAFLISFFIAITLGMTFFAFAEAPKAQYPAVKLQKLPTALSKQRCSINEIFYSPASGLKLPTYVKLVLKYKCEGMGTVGPIEVEVRDGNGKLCAAKRDIIFESGMHELSINIWGWQNYAFSNKIITIIKFKGREFYKRTDMVLCSEWFISNPEVLLNEPITE